MGHPHGADLADVCREEYRAAVQRALVDRRAQFFAVLGEFAETSSELARAADELVRVLRSGGTVLSAGNGGSASESQHFAAELVGRFQRDRAPFAAIALTTDASIMTAVANDYGYEQVFARQVFALGRPGDLLMAYSTSGQSENVVRAAVAAKQRDMTVVAITGSTEGRLQRVADIAVQVPSDDTPVIQELHMIVTHVLCGIVESALAGESM